MKNYAKVGSKEGKPAYRTPSSFLAKKIYEKIRHQSRRIQKFLFKSRKWDQENVKKTALADTEEKR